MSAEIIEATKEETQVDVQKRAFMSKFGKYAVAGAGMAILMSPTTSSANTYPPTTGIMIQKSEVTAANFNQSGQWATEDGSDGGSFSGSGTNGSEGSYDYMGNFTRFDGGESFQWDGSWTFSENNTWSGRGDILSSGSDVGDWESEGSGFWGGFKMWWSGS